MAYYPETKNVQTMNLSVFGWPEDLSDASALKLMTRIAENYDYRPDYGILGVPDTHNVRVLKLNNAEKRVATSSGQHFDYIRIFQSLWGDGKSDWRWASLLEYHVRSARKRFAARCVIHEPSDLNAYFEKAVSLVLAELSPAYGYCSILPLNWDPSAYDSGTLHCVEDAKERQRITDWRNECFWRLGGSNYDVVRDVFPVNFLNARHMSKEIDKLPFADWVVARQLGVIAPVNPGLWKWTLSSSQVRLARPALLEAKFLAATV